MESCARNKRKWLRGEEVVSESHQEQPWVGKGRSLPHEDGEMLSHLSAALGCPSVG